MDKPTRVEAVASARLFAQHFVKPRKAWRVDDMLLGRAGCLFAFPPGTRFTGKPTIAAVADFIIANAVEADGL